MSNKINFNTEKYKAIENALRQVRMRTADLHLLRKLQVKWEGISEAEAIETCTFNHDLSSIGHGGGIADKTAKCALSLGQMLTAINTREQKDMMLEAREIEQALSIIENCVDSLTERQRTVIRLLYYDGVTWDEVCDRLYLTRQGVAGIRRRAISGIVQRLERLGLWQQSLFGAA